MLIKQLTPLISFEVKESDSNFLLRASELKPRITKFIKNEFLNYYSGEKKEKFEELIHNKEIFSEKGCSYFKLLIDPVSIKHKYKFKTYIPRREKNNASIKEGSYFGDYFAIEIADVDIKIVSYIKDLKELVEEAFKYFFVLYNLGARQTKGFGGFIVDGTTQIEFENILKKKYNTIFVKRVSNKFIGLKEILKDYQLLKSGTNKPYKKSLLFEYFAKKDIGWEKRKIKESINTKCPSNTKNNIVNLNKHLPNSEFSDYRYIRALLGVASNISFKTQRRPFIVNIKNNEIEKFASPILFKVYNNKVYALANKLPSKIFNQPFVFKAKSCGDRFLCELNTPSEFNLEEFLNENLIKLKWSKI